MDILGIFATIFWTLLVLCILFAVSCFTLIILFKIPKIRYQYISRFLFQRIRRNMPTISRTEQEAIDAGDITFEGQLFQGHPNWSFLLSQKKPLLTSEEASFLDHEVEALCALLDEWDITHHTLDLPEKAWEMLKSKKFFGMNIPKEYGGLGFSALACSSIVQKITTRSLTAAVTAMVPNSLGPGELLLAYGTETQKQYYLPLLASGQEIPCFALTEPGAGSDAGSITDSGIVCRGLFEGKEIIGMRLTWNKRYITLAPVATVLGLAFKLYDPEGLLGDKKEIGITVCLLPTRHPGVEIGLRHFPLNQPFMNGPTRGENVFVPLEWIIGGPKMAGKGWRMLVECLSAGRGISLPALTTGATKHCYRTAGAYASIRKQFNTPIGCFEGVEEVLARIAGRTYLLEACRIFTTLWVDQGKKPAIASAIAKYHITEAARASVNDAMDVHGGKGIMLGPKNYLGRGYESMPISITVEGANILTRNMIIFGQGAIRCHPFLRLEMQAINEKDETVGLQKFDQCFAQHVDYSVSNILRLIFHAFTAGLFCSAPAIKVNFNVKRLTQQVTRMSVALAVVTDMALLMLGGRLKRKERLSARLGDILSYLYMASAVIKYYHDFGDKKQDLPYLKWCLETALYQCQEAFIGFFSNFGHPVLSCILKFLLFPFGRPYAKPKDALEHILVTKMMTPGEFRDRLTAHCYVGTLENSEVARLEHAFLALQKAEPALLKLETAIKKGHISKHLNKWEKLSAAETQGLLNAEECEGIRFFEALKDEVIQVDAFSQASLIGKN